MSITVQTIITNALSNIGIVGAGGSPSTADNATCLDALKGRLNSYINAGLFGRMDDVVPNVTAYTANENERIINNGSITVTLPTSISQQGGLGCNDWDYGFGLSVPSTRPPLDLAVIEEVRTDTGTTNTYIYDARIRQWVEINALTYTSVCPLAQRDSLGLAAELSLAVADKFGQEPGQLTVMQARNFRAQLSTNWSEGTTLPDPGTYF